MSTDGSTTQPPTPTPSGPANPAKGKDRGQKTLAAKIVRWKRLGTNLAPQIDQMPLFKDQFTQFQAMLQEAESLVSQLDAARANTDDLMARRNQMLTGGDDLFNRLSLALRAIHGPAAGRLREFGLKPHRPGRPKKSTTPVSPAPEAAPAPAAAPETAHPAQK
jgi:hypothetical protein